MARPAVDEARRRPPSLGSYDPSDAGRPVPKADLAWRAGGILAVRWELAGTRYRDAVQFTANDAMPKMPVFEGRWAISYD